MTGEERTETATVAAVEHRPPKPWERERDRAVLRLLMDDWNGQPEPRPDLPTWLSGASTALLLIRQVSS